jgi:PhzF family phenazine biosynthesis protein
VLKQNVWRDTYLYALLKNETVDKANPAANELLGVLKAAGGRRLLYLRLRYESAANSLRTFFNPTVGLWEDAATGTAAGPLAAYLASEGLVANNELAIEQGTKMGRRSILRIRVNLEPELSGTGIVVLRGVLRL